MAKEILRDPTNGRILPGSGALNPGGRPVKKRDVMDRILDRFYGPECEQIVNNMLEIAEYDSKQDYMNTKPNERRYFKVKFTNLQIVDARKFLFLHRFGNPITEVHQEISTPDDKEWKIEVSHVHPKKEDKEDK